MLLFRWLNGILRAIQQVKDQRSIFLDDHMIQRLGNYVQVDFLHRLFAFRQRYKPLGLETGQRRTFFLLRLPSRKVVFAPRQQPIPHCNESLMQLLFFEDHALTARLILFFIAFDAVPDLHFARQPVPRPAPEQRSAYTTKHAV